MQEKSSDHKHQEREREGGVWTMMRESKGKKV